MKTKDIFKQPTISFTPYHSVDVVKFLHAETAIGRHHWTFTSAGGDGGWVASHTGTFREAATVAIKNYCLTYGTKYARLILETMEEA